MLYQRVTRKFTGICPPYSTISIDYSLVGGIPTPLKNMSSSMGRIFPYMENKSHVWNSPTRYRSFFLHPSISFSAPGVRSRSPGGALPPYLRVAPNHHAAVREDRRKGPVGRLDLLHVLQQVLGRLEVGKHLGPTRGDWWFFANNPLKHDGVKVSWDYELPNIWTNKKKVKQTTNQRMGDEIRHWEWFL